MAGTFALAPSRLGPRGIRLLRQSDLRALLVALLTAALIASVLTVADDRFAIDASTSSQEGSVSSAVDEAATPSSQTVLPGQVPEGLTASEWADIQSQIAARQGSAGTAVTAQPAPLVQAPTAISPLTIAPSPNTPARDVPAGGFSLTLPSAAVLSSAGVDAAFSSTSATITTERSAESVVLSTSTIGSSAAGSAVVRETVAGVELVRSGVTEYFHTVAEGIEHGYVIDAPMHAGDDLVIRVDVAAAGLAFVGDDILIDRADGSQLWYRDLFVFDATGAELPASMGIDGTTITLNVDTAGAVYPITVDPILTGDQLLFPLQDAAGDRLGTAVAVDADAPGGALVVVGAPRDDDQDADNGTVYVFRFGGVSFSQEATIYPTTPTEEDFGASVDVRGNRIVVGAPGNDGNGTDAGAVHVFDFAGTWSQTSTIFSCDPTGGPCGDTAAGGFDGDRFGAAVRIANDGGNDVIFVGAPGATVAGAAGGGAFVYEPGGSGWQTDSSRAVANPNATAGDDFGSAVDISANGLNLVVGAPKFDDGFVDEGAAWWFTYSGTTVGAASRLSYNSFRGASNNLGESVAVDVHAGSGDIVAFVGYPIITNEPGDGGTATANGYVAYSIPAGTASGVARTAFTSSTSGNGIVDAFGRSVSFDGTSFAVGSPLFDPVGAVDGGWAGVYTYTSGPATLSFNALVNLPEAAGDEWGDAIAVDGDFVATAGSLVDVPFGDASGVDAGQVAIAQVSDLATAAQLANGQVSNTRDRFGWTVAVDGDRLAVQAPLDDLAGTEAGAVYMYDRADSSSDWVFDAVITSPDPTREDRFGDSLSVLGDRIAIGESDRYGDQAEAGRVFVFERTGPGSWSQVGGEISVAAGYNAFGQSVALHSANRLFIGAPESGTGGEVFVTTETAGVWSAPTALSFSGSPAPVAGDQIGYSIAVDRVNNVLIAGAPGDDDAGADAGAAWFWIDIDTTPAWADVDSSAWNAGDRVGTSVAASPGTYATSGIASALQNDDRQAHLLEDVGAGNFQVFHSIELTLAAGRPNDPNAEIALVGQNLFFGRPGGGGTVEIFRDTDGTGLSTTAVDVFDPPSVSGGAVFGFNVAASGDTLVSGARGDDTQGLNAGVVYTARELGITHNWIGGASGDWEVAANWDTGVVPKSIDTAIIPDSANASVSVNAATQVGVLVLGAGSTVTLIDDLTITGTASNLTSTVRGTLDVLAGVDLTVQAPIDVISGGTLFVRGTAGFQDRIDILGQVTVTATGSADVSNDVRMFGPNGDLINQGQLVMAGDFLRATDGNTITNSGTWRWSSATTQEIQLGGALNSVITNTGTIEKAGAGTFTIPFGIDLDLDPGSVIDIQGGAFNVFSDGNWDGGASQITIQAATGTSMTWGGNQTLTGSIQGTGGATPGRVTMGGTKTWGSPGSVANSLDFGEATPGIGPGGYMLAADAVTFAGDPFQLDGFMNVEGTTFTTFNTDLTIAGTLATTGTAPLDGAINGSGDFFNLGTVIAGAEQFGTGPQSFTNQGLFQAARSLTFLSVNTTWVSDTSSTIEFLPNSITDFQAGHVELGTVIARAGAWGAFSNTNTVASTAEVEIEITGSGTPVSTANYGFIVYGDAAPTVDPAATLRTIGGHSPSGADDYRAIRCTGVGTSPCPLFTTTDLVGYQQVQVGDDVHLVQGPGGPLVVTSSLDDTTPNGQCTLREAIITANTDTVTECGSGFGADTIEFAATGTFGIGSRLPVITSDITINAPKTFPRVAVNGAGSTAILRVEASGTLTLDGIRIINGAEQVCDGGDRCGAVLNYGTLNVIDSLFSGNDNTASGLGNGAAITNRGGGVLNVVGSTFTGNAAAQAGAIWNASDASNTLTVATITNSTFEGNTASGAAGAIYNTFNASMTITNSTFANNVGATTLRNAGGASPIVLENSIVTAPSGGVSCDGPDPYTADAFSFDTDGSCGAASTATLGELALGALADNGGPTTTIALGTTSAAIEAGDPAVCAASPVDGLDQRGEPRDACDVGAYSFSVCDTNWTGAVNTVWSDAGNWDNGVPGTGDLVCMDVSGLDITDVDIDFTVGRLLIAEERININTGDTLTIEQTSQIDGPVSIGGTLAATDPVTLLGGSQVITGGALSGPVTFASIITASDLTLNGVGTTLTVDSQLNLLGDLTLNDGASVVVNDTLALATGTTQTVAATAAGSTIDIDGVLWKENAGAATIDGANGLTMNVAEGSTVRADGGTLDIQAGGTWTGGTGGIDFEVEDGSSVTWGGTSTISGDFTGSFTTAAPGDVILAGTKSTLAVTSFDFPADAADTSDTSLFMLDLADASLSLSAGALTIAGAARISGDLTVSDGSLAVDSLATVAQESGTVTVDGNVQNNGTYRAVDGAGVLTGAGGYFNNNGGVFRTEDGAGNPFDVTPFAFQGAVGSTVVAAVDSPLTFNSSNVFDPGDKIIGAGATLTYVQSPTLGAANWNFGITGPSSSTANYGRVVFPSAPVIGTSTVEATFGYSPVVTDSYPVVDCGAATCPLFGTDNTSPLAQSIVGGDVVLALSVSGPLTLVVDDTGDDGDDNPGDGVCATSGGDCTLRAAIQEANAFPGADTINFNISGAGPHLIQPLTAMTSVTDVVTIDGYSQPGASQNTLAVGSDAVLLIELNGSAAPGAANTGSDVWGFNITPSASGSTVTGMVINGFTDSFFGMGIRGQYVENVTVQGNYIGTNAAGTAAVPNGRGVYFVDLASAPGINIVGGATPGERNVISGNTGSGIDFAVFDTGKQNLAIGNYIGTNAAGSAAIPNAIGINAPVNARPTIGGTGAGEGNLISGNAAGIAVQETATTILGNLIGTDAAGLVAVPNGAGIRAIPWSGTPGSPAPHQIGDGTVAGRNIISGNSVGINAQIPVQLRGNVIGENIAGAPLGNGSSGVNLNYSGNIVGGVNPGDGNVIANNGVGVLIISGVNNSVVGNSISGNASDGLAISGAGPNDPGDPDVGVNNLQNHPEFTATIDAAGDLIIDWSIDSTVANSTYPIQIDVYEADGAATGQGETFLGRATIAAPGADTLNLGNASALGILDADPLVAIATDDLGNSSEFSPVVAATLAPVGLPVIAIDGEWAVVTVPAQGEAFVLRNIAGTWTDVQTISGGGVTGFGASVALSDPYLVIGSPASGRVDFYERPAGGSTFNVSFAQADVTGYGTSLDMSASGLVVIGSPQGTGGAIGSGVANVYDLTTGAFLFNTIQGAAGDRVGERVAITETAVYVAAPGTDLGASTDAGQVYRYDLAGALQVTLQGSSPSVGREYGREIDASGNRVAVAESTSVSVSVVPVSGSSFIVSGASTGFGYEMAIAGDLLVVNDGGAARSNIFDDNGNDLVYSTTGEILQVATDVATDGGTIASAREPAGTATSGLDVATFFAAPIVTPAEKVLPELGSAGDEFGTQVAIDGDTMIVAAPGADGAGFDAGAVYVFERNAGVWGQTQLIEDQPGLGGAVAVAGDVLVATTTTGFAVYERTAFGSPFAPATVPTVATVTGDAQSLAIDGDTLAVGVPGALAAAGEVQVYTGGVAGWTSGSVQTVTSNTGKTATDYFGFSVDVSGDVLVVGAPLTSGTAPGASGYAEIWTRPDALSPFTYSFIVEADILDDFFGWSVAVDGDRVAVGAPLLGDGEVHVFDTTASLLGVLTGGPTLYGRSVDIDAGVLATGNAANQIDSWDVRATPALIQSDAHSDFEALDTGAFEIATSGRTVIVGAPFEDQQGNDAGAVYSFDVPEPVDNLLQNPSPDPSDFFGTSVDIDGDWMVVGAYLDDTVAPNAGAAYAYENVGGRWEFRQSLDGATLASGYNFGWDVAIEDDLIVVATSTEGAAPIFVVSYRLSGGTWTLSEELTVVGAASTYSVDIDGTRVVIGDAFGDTAFVYDDNGTNLVNQVSLPDPNAGAADDFYGYEVGISGDTIAVGAPFQDNGAGADAGAVYIWEFAGTWSVSQAPAPAGLAPSGLYGQAISVDGSNIAAGYPGATSGPDAVGGAVVLSDDGSGWAIVDTLTGSASTDGSLAGLRGSVSLQGATLVVGASRDDTANGADAGATYVFQRNLGVWSEFDILEAPDGEAGDIFGVSAALDAGNVAVGAALAPDFEGGVYVYRIATEDDPTLDFTLDVDGFPTATVAPAGIAIADFNAQIVESTTDAESTLAASPLSEIELEDTPLAGIELRDTPLAGIVLGSTPLAGIPLLNVDVDGGWDVLLAGSELENVPINDLTFGDALEDATVFTRVQSLPLAGIDVDGTPLAGIPLAGIALGSTPLAGIPLAGIGQNWCDIVDDIGVNCTDEATLTDITLMEATLRGVPLAGIPLAGIPLAGIDFAATPLAGIPLAGIGLDSTPLAGIPLAGIDLTGTPLAGIPIDGIDLAELPLAGIPLAGIDVDGTPLAGIPLAGIPLAGIATSIPLAGIPLAGIDVEGAPLAGIPLAGILLMDTPLAGIPLAGIGTGGTASDQWCGLLTEIGGGFDCDNGVDPAATTLFEIAVQGVPLAGIPLEGTPLAGIPLAGIPIAEAPLAGIPLAGIPLAGIPLAGIQLDSTPLAGIPLAGIPLAGIDVQGSPLAGIPLAGIDVGSTPLAGIPLAGIPLAGIPLAGIPLAGIDLAGTPLAGIPLAGIDIIGSPLAGIPLAGIPLAGIPLAGIGIDCETGVVNCELDSLGDAIAAGAVDLNVPLSTLLPALTSLSLDDIASHLSAFTAQDVIDALVAEGLTLQDLSRYDGLTLGDLPATDPAFANATLGAIEDALLNVSFEDLARALVDPNTGISLDDAAVEAALRDAIDAQNLLIEDLDVAGDITVGDLLGGSEGNSATLADLGTFLGLIPVQSILDATANSSLLTNALDGTLGLLTDEQLAGLTLGDLVGVNEFGVIDVVALLDILDAAGLLGDFSLGDLLLGLVDAGQLPFGGFDFTEVETGQLPEGTVTDLSYDATFTVGDSFSDQLVEVAIALPTTATYVPGSGSVDGPGGVVELEPVIEANQVIWTIEGVLPGETYIISFDVRPEVSLGVTSLDGTARIVGSPISQSDLAAISVLEGSENNDFPPPNVTSIDASRIYLTYISDSEDIDVFEVAVQENDVLAIELSGLPADFDIALYAVPTDTTVGSALSGTSDNDPVIPISDPDQSGADAEPLNDFVRLDQIDPSLQLLEVSNTAGLDNEVIVTDRLPAGVYYIQVFGANGASSPDPAVLQVQLDAAEARPDCVPAGPGGPEAPGVAPSLTGTTANTLFLVNEMRLERFHSAGDRAAVMAELGELVTYLNANPSLGIDPLVVPVDGFANIEAAYDAWDNPADPEDACDPGTANAVVAEINATIIDPLRDQLEYVVILGGDEQIPFARLEDNTTIANEYDYRHEFDGDLAGANANGANAFTATFWERQFLSDEPYGESAAQSLGNRFLYVSDLSLGRVVESPTQIVQSLDDFVTHGGSLDIDNASVLGYDFLVDGSNEIAANIADSALPVSDFLADGSGDPDTIPDNGGTAWDAVQATMEMVAAGQNSLISLNAHFDHYRALPAVGDQVPGFNDNLIATDVSAASVPIGGFQQTLIFSMGCHSGLAVPDSQIALTSADWAQELTGTGALYVGNTGFGYGDTEAVAYTEQLMANFAYNVSHPTDVNGLPTTVGQALTFAKNEYVAELAVLSVYDEKAVMESTFYGLPFYRTDLPTQPLPAPPTNVPSPDATGAPALVVNADPENTAVTTPSGTYFTNFDDDGNEQTIVAPGRPIQPSDSADISVVDPAAPADLTEIAHGAILLDMTSVWNLVPDPVIATPIFDESVEQPEPEVGDVTFPAKPVSINTSLTPGGERQTLVLATGQYRSENQSQRLDDDIEVVVYYAPPSETDFTEPEIGAVESTLVNGLLSVTLTASDDHPAGVDKVYLLIAEDPGTTVDWIGLDLGNTGGDEWAGSIQLTAGVTDVEFLVQVRDGAGNVAYATNKANNFSDDTTPPPPPPPTPDLDVQEDPTNLDPGGSGWYTGDVTIVVDSGTLGATYTIDDGAPQPVVGGQFTFSGEGPVEWAVTTEDGVQTQSGTVFIDTDDAPDITPGTPVVGGSYPTGSGTVDFTCTDVSLVDCEITIGGVVVEPGDPLPTTPGGYNFSITASDVLGNPATVSGMFDIEAVIDQIPTIELIDAPTTPQLITDGATVVVEFDDLDGVSDDYTVSFDWGDYDENETPGSSTVCTASSSSTVGSAGASTCELVAEPDAGSSTIGTFASSILYAEPGVYTLTATVTDSVGNSVSQVFEFLVVYDPAGGRVSGAGWFWSDNSSYPLDNDPWGNWAFFGYRARYRNGEDTPRGRTKLHLLGEFFFRSTSYDYLIINDTTAVAEGDGRVGGQSGYRFRIQGIDNGWIDYVQITIWNEATGETVYDNGAMFDEGDLVLFGGIRIRS